MNHLLKKIGLAGAKGSKPKAKPAILKPPVVGELQLSSSYSYAETLDIISDGPIEGLVNKNGLTLTDEHILQGIYLDDTPIAVSNDQALSRGASYDPLFTGIYNTGELISGSVQLFNNLKNLNIATSSYVTPSHGFKCIGYKNKFLDDTSKNQTFFDDYDTAIKINLSGISGLNRQAYVKGIASPVVLSGVSNQYFLNTFPLDFNLSIWGSNVIDDSFINLTVQTHLTLVNQLGSAITNNALIGPFLNAYEKEYATKIFNRNIIGGWNQASANTLVTNWIKTIKRPGDMFFVIKVKDLTLVAPNISLVTDGKLDDFRFVLENVDGIDLLERDPNVEVYDFILPRMNDNGTTNGRCYGCLIFKIRGEVKKRANKESVYYEYWYSYSISNSVLNSLCLSTSLKLRKVSISTNPSINDQKYNYTNILAEYRDGSEYQHPFKYFNNVLIDKAYNSSLLGPFRVDGSVQRILENSSTLLTGYGTNIAPTGADPTGQYLEGSIDGTWSTDPKRLSSKSYSEWNVSQSSFNEEGSPIKHVVINPNVSSVFITICVQSLGDTASQEFNAKTNSTSSTTQKIDAGTKFPTIVNLEVEVGIINPKGEETVSSKRKFKIVSLIESATYIDIGNPDGSSFKDDDDYKFISEYSPEAGASIFKPFDLPSVESSISAEDSSSKRYVKVSKLSTETNSTLISKEISLTKITEIIPSNFSYPFSTIVGTKIDSRSFSTVPTRTFDCKLKKIKVPSNYYPCLANGKDKRYYYTIDEFNLTAKLDTLIYDGDWDGEFKEDLQWTDNPAWILYDLLTNERYGLGQYLDISQIDIFDLYKIGRFCDSVDDLGYFQGTPDGAGGLEPRFSCNILFADGMKIFDAINVVASLFRGIVYYNNSQINFVDDRPKETVALFSNSNVKDGLFDYSNYRRDEQFNSIEVVYIDRFENFLTKVEYVEDEEDIRKRGVFKKTINADGVTSKAMARRLGQHLIFQTIKENQSVSFTAGLESLLCKPGDLIIVEDELKSLKSNFGRVLSVNPTTKSIRLSEKFSSDDFQNKLTVYTPTGYSTFSEISDLAQSDRGRVNGSGFYLTSGGWSSTHNYLTGFYQFIKYEEGFSEAKTTVDSLLRPQYAYYSGTGSNFCYFSTGFTGWVLGSGTPFTNDNSYNKFIFETGVHNFTDANRGLCYPYSGQNSSGRGSSFVTALNGQVSGSGSKFRDIGGVELIMTNGLLDSDISLTSPVQITTFGLSGIVEYDYGCEAFVHSGDINYSLVPFAKEGSAYRFQRKNADDQIYKVISIKEANPNEYSLICTKFNTGKYALIENQQSIEYQANTYSYSLSQKIGDTNYLLLNTPIINSIITGANVTGFYLSGKWEPVLNAQGYNIRLYQPNGVLQETTLIGINSTGHLFYAEGIGNYSYRVSASGSYSNGAVRSNTYFNSEYDSSGLFLIYEDSVATYDRPFLSSVTIL
jgi:hypothetical protein